MAIPPDAQRSDDGAYWWDETKAEWQLITAEDLAAEVGSSSAGAATSTPPDAEGDATLQWEHETEDSMDLSLDEIVSSGWEPGSDGTEDVA